MESSLDQKKLIAYSNTPSISVYRFESSLNIESANPAKNKNKSNELE